MSYKEISQKAGLLHKGGQYAEAVPHFEALFDAYNDESSEFDWWGFAHSLLKLDLYQRTLEVSRGGLKKFPKSDYLKTTYAWAIYHLHISPEPVKNRETFFKAAQAVVKFSGPENKYSPFAITIFKVIDLLELDYNQHVFEILQWVQKLKPEYLDRRSYSFVNPKGQQVKDASPYEKYYAILVKALYEVGNYEACIAEADIALAAINPFHYGNEVWISRNRALALFKTGRYQPCADALEQLLQIKPVWYIRKEMADVLEALGKFDEALLFAAEAALEPITHPLKINLYMLLARLFRKTGRAREACLHAALVNMVRQQEQWPADDEAMELIRLMAPQGFQVPAFHKLEAELTEIWNTFKPEKPRLSGKISFLLKHGKAGFIVDEKGVTYYFSVRDFLGNEQALVPNCKVTFAVTTAFDKVKQKPSVKAVEIQLAD